MKGLYVILVLSSFVVAVWSCISGYIIYRIGKDIDIWHTCWVYIDRWIKWRYGLAT